MVSVSGPFFFFSSIVLAISTGLASYCLIAGLIGWLNRHVVAVPNDRSSHSHPRPQGGGIAVAAVAIVGSGMVLAVSGTWLQSIPYSGSIAVAAGFLALVGLADDAYGLPIAPRLAFQALSVTAAVVLLPTGLHVLDPLIPIPVERALLIGAGLWFINLFNFMDGIDWLAATETVAITIGIVILVGLGLVPTEIGFIAVALLGAMLGFMPWNAPPARLFLGNAGSLPIGFILGVLLLHIAAAGALAAALILPLYYVADATITLLRRAWNREGLLQAHRSHFYQRATKNGLNVKQTLVRIAAANAGLIILAIFSTLPGIHTAALAIAGAVLLVARTLFVLAKT